MYRSYTQIFRILRAVIIFLQISKVTALFKIQKIGNLPVLSPSLSLTGRTRMSATQRENAAALPTPASKTRRR